MVDGGGTVVVVVADVVVVVAAVDGISALTVVSAPEGCSSAAVRSGTAVWEVPDGTAAGGTGCAHPVSPRSTIPASHAAARFPLIVFFFPSSRGNSPAFLKLRIA